MKKITIPLFFTLILSLIIIYILHPLNNGGVALVFVLCSAAVFIVQAIIKSTRKKPGNEK